MSYKPFLRSILVLHLTFNDHLSNVLKHVNEAIGLSGSTLITIYKAFVRPHLDYGHIIYDETYNSYFYEKP